MRTRLFVVAACLTLLVCVLAVPSLAAEVDTPVLYATSSEVAPSWEVFQDMKENFPSGNDNYTFDSHMIVADYYYDRVIVVCWDSALGSVVADYSDLRFSGTSHQYGFWNEDTATWDMQSRFGDSWWPRSDDYMIYTDVDLYDSSGSLLYPADYLCDAVEPPPPSPIESLMNDVGALFSAAIGFVGIVATTVVGNPILLLFAVLSLVGIGVGLFVRLKNVSR